MSSDNMPVRETMCATCPFRPGSKTAYLAETLAASALSEASRICHSTGSDNAFHKRTGKPPHICRGSRDVQLGVMASYGVIAEPTDEAWNNQRVAIGMKRIAIKDPE